VAVEHASRDIELATGKPEGSFDRLYGVIKRCVDLAGSVIGLIVLAVLIPVVWLANRVSSPGPLYYRQERVGLGGKSFEMIKFRSMKPDAEIDEAVWASAQDGRVTPIGRVLRGTHLDELPQAVNVLRGEMSLVGPRPERPEFVQKLSQTIPFYRARHCMKPGITGWAQVHQDYGDSVERAREKLEYDLYYVKRASSFLDLVIVLRTISKMVGFRGR
jgi:lipopolysaccharide/colanic/teichoic acid biosynthesis glycosyltransferase